MDTDKYEKAPSELPAPSYKLDLGPSPSDNSAESVTSMNIERGVAQGGQQPPATTLPAQLTQQAGHTGSTAPLVSSTTALPQIADDNDLIEKEWVAKAKQIVEKTKNDPRAQNAEMSVVKAGYIKKRFNKDIKVNDSQ